MELLISRLFQEGEELGGLDVEMDVEAEAGTAGGSVSSDVMGAA